MFSKIYKNLAKIKQTLESIESSTKVTKEKRIYAGITLLEMLSSLQENQETLVDLAKELSDPECSADDFTNKIELKQQSIIKTSEFIKTFGPMMLLHNMGLVNRTWQ